MKKFLPIILMFYVFLAAKPVSADFSVANASSELKIAEVNSDYRVIRLTNFFKKQNSPLEGSAGDFIKIADKYGLDWRLVPAISGVESSFGKRMPENSYNAYGWAGGKYRFTSWENSIETVSKSLKENYIEKGAPSLTAIGRRYCPPNPAWSGRVRSIMNKIESLPLSFDLES